MTRRRKYKVKDLFFGVCLIRRERHEKDPTKSDPLPYERIKLQEISLSRDKRSIDRRSRVEDPIEPVVNHRLYWSPMSTHTIARGGVDTRERGAFPMPDEARSSTRDTSRRFSGRSTRCLAKRRLREVSGYLQDWTVVRLDDGIRWLLGYHAGQLGGGLHGVSVLDGHVVGNSPPSGRRSAKFRDPFLAEGNSPSRFHPFTRVLGIRPSSPAKPCLFV